MQSRAPANVTNFFKQYQQFAEACNIHQGDINGSLNLPNLILAKRLIEEEYGEEFLAAWAKFIHSPSMENRIEIADAIADTIYVLCQLAHVADIPLDRVFEAVHANNMTKIMPDGKVHKRDDGKILKPDGFKPLDLWPILEQYANERARELGRIGAENWCLWNSGNQNG